MIGNTQTLLVAAALTAVFVAAAIPAWNTVSQKAEGQNAALGQLSRWKSEYESLKPTQRQWERQLTPATHINDLYDLIKVVGLEQYGLSVDTEKLVITKIEPVADGEDTHLDADRVCLTTGGLQGIVVTTADNLYTSLITGIGGLAKRKDIEIHAISISTTGGIAKATIPLCLRLRR